MPKVSVILPCYNVAPYIDVCLDSLVNQTLHDIEIICVDDKSTDDTVAIIKKRAKSDPRIRLVELPENAGVSVARNTGIDAATGEYIGFVDPDDYVDLDFYEKLYEVATKENADIVKGDLTIINTSGGRACVRMNNVIQQNKMNFCREFTSAIYKKKLLDDNALRFLPGVPIGEDINWLIKTVYLANKIPVIDSVSYMYVRRDGSAYTGFLTREKIEKVCAASRDLLNWANNQKNINHDEYINVMRTVYSLQTDNIDKCMTYQDKKYVCKNIIDTYQETKYKGEVLKLFFPKYARVTIKYGWVDKLLLAMQYSHKRYNLFGLIPTLKILYAPGLEYRILLFDVIPLFRCKHCLHKDKIYICGVLFLKISH